MVDVLAMNTSTNHGSAVPLPVRREIPSWVGEFFARPGNDVSDFLGSGLVQMRDGVVIDRWDFPRSRA